MKATPLPRIWLVVFWLAWVLAFSQPGFVMGLRAQLVLFLERVIGTF